MKSPPPELFNERSNWAMVALLLTALVGTWLAPGFQAWPLHGPVLLLGVGGMFLVDWFEIDLRHRFPGTCFAMYHGVEWGLFLAMNLTSMPGNFIWLLAMAPFSQSVGRLRWYWATLVGLAYLSVSTLKFLNWQLDWNRAPSFVLSIGVAYIFTAVCTVAMTQAFRAQRRSEELARELEAVNAQLRASAAQQAALAASEERNRIARDIHDGLGHYLTVVTVQLQAAQALFDTDPGRTRESLKSAEQLTHRALEEVRRSVGALRGAGKLPPLSEALSGLVAEAGVPTQLSVLGTPRALSTAVEQAVFRTVQEGLTNIRKHARATRVDVRLSYAAPGQVSVELVDDGCGDTPRSEPSGGFGLVGLRERVLQLGGKVHASRQPGGGFCLRVEVPVFGENEDSPGQAPSQQSDMAGLGERVRT